MNLKRAFLIMTAAILMPGLTMAQVDLSFAVTKEFADFNPSSVEVTISCNTGIPLTQSAEISELNSVVFVVTAIPDIDIVECVITEDSESGYDPTYVTNDAAPIINGLGCFYDGGGEFDNIRVDLPNTCNIFNIPTPVPVVISKDWDLVGAVGGEVDMDSTFYVFSMGSISGGAPCLLGEPLGLSEGYDFCAMLRFVGDNELDFPQAKTVTVRPEFGGTVVVIEEFNQDSAVVVTNDCGGSVTVSPGDAAESCAFTNTVFFEGIPTLNQYGMAILALLMLGVGFVGFRRFA